MRAAKLGLPFRTDLIPMESRDQCALLGSHTSAFAKEEADGPVHQERSRFYPRSDQGRGEARGLRRQSARSQCGTPLRHRSCRPGWLGSHLQPQRRAAHRRWPYNHLLPGQEKWGAADQQFPELVDPVFRPADGTLFDPDGPGPAPAMPTAPNYNPSNNPELARLRFEPAHDLQPDRRSDARQSGGDPDSACRSAGSPKRPGRPAAGDGHLRRPSSPPPTPSTRLAS